MSYHNTNKQPARAVASYVDANGQPLFWIYDYSDKSIGFDIANTDNDPSWKYIKHIPNALANTGLTFPQIDSTGQTILDPTGQPVFVKKPGVTFSKSNDKAMLAIAQLFNTTPDQILAAMTKPNGPNNGPVLQPSTPAYTGPIPVYNPTQAYTAPTGPLPTPPVASPRPATNPSVNTGELVSQLAEVRPALSVALRRVLEALNSGELSEFFQSSQISTPGASQVSMGFIGEPEAVRQRLDLYLDKYPVESWGTDVKSELTFAVATRFSTPAVSNE